MYIASIFDAIEVHLVVIMITIIVPNPTRTTFVIKNEENKGENEWKASSRNYIRAIYTRKK